MSALTSGRLAAALPLLLLSCHGSDQAERLALQDKLKAQEKLIDDQEREIAWLRQQLADRGAEKPAAARSTTSPVGDAEGNETRWRLALKEVNHRGQSFRARFDVTNLSAKRQVGSLCAQLFDRAGAQIDHLFSSEHSVAGRATEVVELDAPLSEQQWGEVQRIDAYIAPLGCADDAPAHPLSVDKTGRPIPQSDR